MTSAIVKAEGGEMAAGLERVLVQGDLSKLTPDQRVVYYERLCESLGLNPLTKPFEYLTLQGKTVLYARRDCTDQLRKIHKVSIKVVSRETVDDLLVVTTQATLADGRCDESIGAVSIRGLSGESLANALMKADTKAKRRVTLSICGLGMLDESEVPSGGFDATTGEVTPLHHQLPKVSPHSHPDEPDVAGDPDLYADFAQQLETLKADIAACESYDGALACEARVRAPGNKQSPLTLAMQKAKESGQLSDAMRAELGKVWQHCKRQVEKKLEALKPPLEASFVDEPDVEREAIKEESNV